MNEININPKTEATALFYTGMYSTQVWKQFSACCSSFRFEDFFFNFYLNALTY